MKGIQINFCAKNEGEMIVFTQATEPSQVLHHPGP